MSEEIIEDNKVDTQNDKLFADLKKKADLLGVKYSGNIGFDKLKTKVELFLEDQEDEVITTKSVGPNKSVIDIEKAAKKPMLVIVNDLDASQQNDPTIVTNIGNKFFKIGCITQKGIEQLVPTAVVDALKAKTMVQWVDDKHAITKRPTGNRVAKTTARYNIQILDANPKI
jgi:hypothetical protein